MINRFALKFPKLFKPTTRNYSWTSKTTSQAVILSAVRTPIGSLNGVLSSLPGTKLASISVKEAVKRAGIQPTDVKEAYLGNVVQANQGQAPARQAIIGAGLPTSIPCTTVNKVCASGMKAIMLASQTVMLGQGDVLVAGGFESMSNVPYYMERGGLKYGHSQAWDGIIKDGLWDVYNNFHMGNCGEDCAKKFNISRQEQDDYAISSYKRSAAATESGAFKEEIVAVEVPQKKGDVIKVTEDEEYKRIQFDKVSKLKPAFQSDGTVTAANASSINDGASALIVASTEFAKSRNLSPMARVISFADAARDPIEFTIAPVDAIRKALDISGLKVNDIDYWEINEAFSVVAVANMRLLGLDAQKLNVNGGSVSLGHPIGCSGARIVTTLLHVLKQKGGKYGCAAVCNGGGGASAIIVERI
eukprot:TRINITY_DN7359_c0_g1_i1.p1 TRINITY_DN7359_c0_g1~~TRINITY_DN7359_c0_g1_i1.p1  ORF type:complete len:417 (-),score=92.36 TRINITY_DN7359_c0_g1_i1:47-1297(-)